MNSNSLSHTKWDCKYHIVWIPKYRLKIIYGDLRKEIGVILRKLCEYKKIEIVEASACRDHIHICLSIPPKHSVSEIVGYLKGKSAIMIFEKFSKIGQNFKGNSFWARGYFVSTVGRDEETIKKYIREQETEDTASERYNQNKSNPF